MDSIVEKLQALAFYNLVMQSPVLSGNMQMFIQMGFSGMDKAEIIIDAPFYDMKQWKKTGAIVHTGKNIKGVTAYANWVNEVGAFGRHNESEHWVNRVLVDCCNVIAQEIGAEVINELPI